MWHVRGCGVAFEDKAATLKACGIADNAVLNVTAPGVPIPGPKAGEPPNRLVQAAQLQRQLRADPYSLSTLRQNNPPLAEAVLGDDLTKLAEILQKQDEQRKEAEMVRIRRAAALQANPFDVEAQRAMESEIQNGNVEQLRQQAIEHMPESFASVHMLYINVIVNNVPLKAFVDSGAQMTIMSSSCAERCGLMRLCDRRFEGTAVGVGTQKILGKVHMCQLQIENDFLPTSLSILEKQDMDFLLGLDMLKRHRCCINLATNTLEIGTTGTQTRFLPEAELPRSARLNSREPEPESGATSASGGGGSAAPAVDEAALTQLLTLGEFSREQAIEALVISNGDSAAAASYLFSQMAT